MDNHLNLGELELSGRESKRAAASVFAFKPLLPCAERGIAFEQGHVCGHCAASAPGQFGLSVLGRHDTPPLIWGDYGSRNPLTLLSLKQSQECASSVTKISNREFRVFRPGVKRCLKPIRSESSLSSKIDATVGQ